MKDNTKETIKLSMPIITFILGVLLMICIDNIPKFKYDVNNDGKVTPADAVKVINYYLDQRQ